MTFHAPTNELGGSGLAAILEEWMRFRETLDAALHALPHPHPRDYCRGHLDPLYADSVAAVQTLRGKLLSVYHDCVTILDPLANTLDQ